MNEALIVKLPGTSNSIINPNRWTPLTYDLAEQCWNGTVSLLRRRGAAGARLQAANQNREFRNSAFQND